MGSLSAPATLQQGMRFRIVFVTDGTTDSIPSDHGHYDSLVQAEAAAAGLDKNISKPVKWLALISARDGTKATDRLPIDNVPLYTLSGDLVSSGDHVIWGDSMGYGRPVHPINQSPTQSGITGDVWTGTRPGGDCVSEPLGAVYRQQNAYTSIADFSSEQTQPYERRRLFAFSEVITVG